jgi:hypothetical protein
VHVTETCDDDEPHLIIHTETTAATTPDWGMADPIHSALEQQDCLPSKHVVDGGYVDAEAIVTSQTKHAVELFGPVTLREQLASQSGRWLRSLARAISIGRARPLPAPLDNGAVPGRSLRIAVDKKSFTSSSLLLLVSCVRAVGSVRRPKLAP